MNVAKLFLINILLGVAFILLAGCTPVECEVSMNEACVKAVVGCETDTECEALDPYFEAIGPEATLQDALALKAECDADPEDLLDMQECPR